MHYILYIVFYTLYSIDCILYIVFYTLIYYTPFIDKLLYALVYNNLIEDSIMYKLPSIGMDDPYRCFAIAGEKFVSVFFACEKFAV